VCLIIITIIVIVYFVERSIILCPYLGGLTVSTIASDKQNCSMTL